MRILLVDPSSHGGIPVYTALTARALAALGVECEVLASRGLRRAPERIALSQVFPVEPWGRPDGAGLGFLTGRARTWARSAGIVLAAVRRRQPDVIHFQAPLNRRLDAHLVRLLARARPVVWTAHDVLPYEMTEADRKRFAAIYRAASAVIVHTEPAAAQLRGLAAVDPTVIEHPVDEDVLAVPAEQARAALGLEPDGRLFCALGFIRRYKGLDLLASVWELLGPRAPRLLVMGELLAEEERPVLERLSRCPGVELRLGYADERELQLAVCAADALLLPYATASDSGVLHRGRAAGVPVIASDAPQLAASVRATGSGAVVPRDPAAWARAVTGELPTPPPRPPDNATIAAKHRAVYERVLAGRGVEAEAQGSTPRARDAGLAAPSGTVAGAPPYRLVFYTDATERGGAEVMLGELIAALDRTFEVTVMGVSPELVEWVAGRRPGTATRLVAPVRDKLDLWTQVGHWRALRALRPDLVQANLRHPFSCQYAVAAALLIPGTRVVAVEHLVTAPTAELQLRFKRLTSRRLDAHVAVGSRAARELETMLGVGRGSLRVIHNGVRPSDPALGPQVDDALPIRAPNPHVRIAAIGRLTEQKGFDVLLRALVHVPGVRAAVIGDGPERKRLERLRDELDLQDRVELPGWVADAAAVMAGFDALVLPSRFEALPLVVLEAMHAGLPVVASDVGDVAEAVIDGQTGVLAAPGDELALAAALQRILDPSVRERMGARGQQIARDRFTSKAMARQYELLYRELLGGKPVGR